MKESAAILYALREKIWYCHPPPAPAHWTRYEPHATHRKTSRDERGGMPAIRYYESFIMMRSTQRRDVVIDDEAPQRVTRTRPPFWYWCLPPCQQSPIFFRRHGATPLFHAAAPFAPYMLMFDNIFFDIMLLYMPLWVCHLFSSSSTSFHFSDFRHLLKALRLPRCADIIWREKRCRWSWFDVAD
jgi:hypothetical protein